MATLAQTLAGTERGLAQADYPKGHGGKRVKSGRKNGDTKVSRLSKTPQHVKSIRVIAEKTEKRLWKQALRIALETRNVDALIRALVHVNEIHRGRPYVATNPEAMAPRSTDDRLVMAIQNLQIVSQTPGQTSKSQVAETKETKQLQAECQSFSSESDIEAKENTRESSADYAQIDR